ncbi:hypothetical protein B0I35DRAFT_476742 [Stachybotrys elegans]|uniref:Uncharacterized protein n=1 Tax=Stachybotrys elegans TaxID=80388 RepID=A0A8K0SVV0_9HYPO|nr:hypothetical protein B0I35DRAFT_476742 [Stachybotrys elegans]
MSALKNATVMLGLVATGLAVAPHSNFHSTETVGPQELGSTTVDGFFVYSMNYCTIVHHTECQVSLSTGGPAPVPEPTSAPGESGTPEEPTGPGSSYVGPSPPEATQPGETGHSTGNPEQPPTTGQPTESYPGEPTASPTGSGSVSEPSGGYTGTPTDGQEGTPTGSSTSTPSVDAASSLTPLAFIGIAGLAAALLL